MTDLERLAKGYLIRERSDYQLRHFVIGQHDTPEMQYRQIIIEIKSLITRIRIAELDLEKLQIKMDRLSDDPLDQVKMEKHRIGYTITKDAVDAAKQELAFLIGMANEYPHYTPEDIESNQETYWQARLQRQATLDRMSVEQQVSVGNLSSMLNAGLLNREITA